MKRGLAAFVAGAVFSAGLCISGMTQPAKVLAFLDVAGAWDPSLAFVMVGAIGVASLAFLASARRAAPVLDDRFRVPSRRARIDAKLLMGAALFGVGWGLSGLCPGPAIVSIASGQLGAIVFVASMIAGMAIHRSVARAASGAGARGASAEERAGQNHGA